MILYNNLPSKNYYIDKLSWYRVGIARKAKIQKLTKNKTKRDIYHNDTRKQILQLVQTPNQNIT